MSKGNTFENDFMKLIFNAVAIANLAQDGVSPVTVLEVSLHTADPGEAGDQSTSEANYTGYARVPVNRNSGGWTVSANAVSNTAKITFGTCTAGSNAITHFAVGMAHTGTGKILYSGALNQTLNVSAGITPEFAIGELDISED